MHVVEVDLKLDLYVKHHLQIQNVIILSPTSVLYLIRRALVILTVGLRRMLTTEHCKVEVIFLHYDVDDLIAILTANRSSLLNANVS